MGVHAGYGADFCSLTKVAPVQAFYLSDVGGDSKLELALGITIASEIEGDPLNWDGPRSFMRGFFGYRYHRPHGLIFRVGIVPLTWTNNQLPWLTLSFGKNL